MSDIMISVVLPVYNGEKYLDEAIQSILNQTYSNFELIIINDGSSDKSLEIITNYMKEDKRIILISRENKGLIFSLNEGISQSKGKFIARMDADDISLPDRFQKQVHLLQNSDIDICGCHYFIVDKNNKYLSTRVVSTDVDFNKIILVRSVPFAHGSVMFKKEFYQKNNLSYGNTEFNKSEDYSLWIDFESHGAKISNVDEFLFKYRHLDNSLSKQSINYIHGLKLSKKYIKVNEKKIRVIFEKYQNDISALVDFEKELLSYFLLKTLFKGNILSNIKYVKKLPISINIINAIRIIFGK